MKKSSMLIFLTMLLSINAKSDPQLQRQKSNLDDLINSDKSSRSTSTVSIYDVKRNQTRSVSPVTQSPQVRKRLGSPIYYHRRGGWAGSYNWRLAQNAYYNCALSGMRVHDGSHHNVNLYVSGGWWYASQFTWGPAHRDQWLTAVCTPRYLQDY